MQQLASMGGMGIWIGIFSAFMFTVCLYFSLTYFEHLKNGNDRLIRQSKLIAVISLVLALMVPAFYQLYLFNEMVKIN